MSDAPPYLTPFDRDDDSRGTSTSDAEAPLRDIGRVAFRIEYPRDVTPRQPNKRLPPPKP